MFLSQKTYSGALQLAVIISFIAIVITSFFILYIYLSSRIIDKESILLRQLYNTNSFLTEKIASSSLTPENGVEWFLEQDSIHWKTEYWGAHLIISAHTNNSIPVKQVYCLGKQIDTTYTVYVYDNNEYLAVSGNTIIEGNVSAPRLGIQPQMVGNTGFSGTYGTIQKSDKQLPDISEQILKQIVTYNALESNTGLSMESHTDSDSLCNSFFNEPVTLYNPMTVPSYIRGKVRIVSDTKIDIYHDHNWNDIICIAPVVHIHAGFKGALQIFARDSIIVDSHVELQQSSFLSLYREDLSRDITPIIRINQFSHICGAIYLNVPQFYRHYPRIVINKIASIHGEIFSQNYVENNGVIIGNVHTKSFYTKLSQGIYTNCLYNARFMRGNSQKTALLTPALLPNSEIWQIQTKLY
ncbi:MAG: hypothetical protein ACOCWB_08760 [Bacteroidota bacterium]